MHTQNLDEICQLNLMLLDLFLIYRTGYFCIFFLFLLQSLYCIYTQKNHLREMVLLSKFTIKIHALIILLFWDFELSPKNVLRSYY